MKRELALQLLRKILPESTWNEDRFQKMFAELGILAQLKYDRYEMFQPGQLFFENLYAWLSKFDEADLSTALEFVKNNLIFISREEFEQLTQVLYHDRIRQSQFDLVSSKTNISRYKISELAGHWVMGRIQRASLYVAMSDGARIDYFRRQNLDISNEQVLPHYEPSDSKIKDVLRELEKIQGAGSKFECIFLIDDFTASGRTLLRELVTVELPAPVNLLIPENLKGRIKYDIESQKLQMPYSEAYSAEADWKELFNLNSSYVYQAAIESMREKHSNRETTFTGSLIRLSERGLFECLTDSPRLYYCPLLITEYALKRLKDLIPRIQNEHLRTLEILPGAVIANSVRIAGNIEHENVAMLCEKYYSTDLEDEHTGNVKFGYDACGLPVVLHHNTPNNSIYLLWARKWAHPLFPRYERHGRNVK